MPEFTGWRAWLLCHLPWYDVREAEAKHAHDAALRREATTKVQQLVDEYRQHNGTLRKGRHP